MTTSEISIIRFESGEEIICDYSIVENADGKFYRIKSPAILIPGPEGKLMFARWLPYADIENGIDIPASRIVFVVKPMQDLVEHYNSVVVNNIFVPQKKLATPELKLSLD
jgi:hypothetical protein